MVEDWDLIYPHSITSASKIKVIMMIIITIIYDNGESDRKLKTLVIVKQILLVSGTENV